jgi:hypothetical protein
MVEGEGLHQTSKGKRIRFACEQRSVFDGPFPYSKELCYVSLKKPVFSLQNPMIFSIET